MAPLLALLPNIFDTIKSYFPPDATPEQKAEFERKLLDQQQEAQKMVIDAGIKQEEELTKRLQADMASDSWLSKNVRPLVLLYLIGLYSVLAVSSVAFTIDPIYVDMLSDMLTAAFGFYFVSRGIEKVTDKITAGWGKR